ncbi:MAG: hypothetical protein ACRC2T_16480, partial [Thermoguttaceae bacterium]
VLDDDAFSEYCTVIGGKNVSGEERLLVASSDGNVLLIDLKTPSEPKILSKVKVISDTDTLVAYPAVVGNRLFIRSAEKIMCLVLP